VPIRAAHLPHASSTGDLLRVGTPSVVGRCCCAVLPLPLPLPLPLTPSAPRPPPSMLPLMLPL